MTLWTLHLQVSLLEENIKPRANLPPLLVHLRERRPEKLNYIGVSFGLTLDLFRFWRRHKFGPFFIAPNAVRCLFFLSIFFSLFLNFTYFHMLWWTTWELILISFNLIMKNAVTGEHTCMVLKPLSSDDIEVDESDEWGFFGPFYRGTLIFNNYLSLLLLWSLSFVPSLIICGIFLEFRRRFARRIFSDVKLSNMDYKLVMR